VVRASRRALTLDEARDVACPERHEVGVSEASGGTTDPPVLSFEDAAYGAFSVMPAAHSSPHTR
jgi:hypothetical protein